MQGSSELSDLMHRYWQAFSTGDVEFVEAHLSTTEAIFGFGTDPDEAYEGSQVHRVFREQLAAAGGSVTIVPGEVRAYVEGSVGWVSDNPTFHLPDGVRIPARFTAVAHREDGDWKLVQAHTSVGVPNEQLLHMALPT
ncbi:nuclear transport factor 2 family protein [Krasilnikovia sp. M28-CT-15]|uniref:nuclear transport factor 2 family protein n=1 Tax=Krasilnikovia sp. M28-CT-15 TaxID=3373540 RepID=UPI0038775DDA